MPRLREPASFTAVAPFGASACLVRSDSPRLLRNWRVCRVVVTDCRCAPAFLAGCGTRSARHAAPPFPRRPPQRTDCHAATNAATRRPKRPSGPALRGFGSREGGANDAFGGGCQPRRATDVSASETWWSERVRAATGPREREDERGAHPRARGQCAESAAALIRAALTLLRMFRTSTPRLKAMAK